MIFATFREGGADGTLLVVNRKRTHGVRAIGIAATLQLALDDWDKLLPRLKTLADALEAGKAQGAFELNPNSLMAPLPRAYAFFDAGCYPHHMIPIRQARGANMPEDFYERPMMYEGCSAPLVSATEPMLLAEDVAWGIDLEAELAIVTSNVPAGVARADAAKHIRLIGLYNDISLRKLVPPELARGFGFLQSKPLSSMAPFLITPDELGELWSGDFFLGGRYLLHVRGVQIGDLDPAKDAVYTYSDLIVHATKTRPLMAGTLIAAGTLANEDRRHGCGCLAELRAREQLAGGEALTPFLHFGDEYRLEYFDLDGTSVFGAIHQRIERAAG